jgi:hypothetical protein
MNIESVQSIYLEYADEVFQIDYTPQVDIDSLIALLSPSFRVVEKIEAITCKVELSIGELDLSWNIQDKPWRLPPILKIDDDAGGGLRVTQFEDNIKTIFREAEPDCSNLEFKVTQYNKLWQVKVADPTVLGIRAISRLFKQLVGHVMMEKKAQIFHASCVNLNNYCYVFYGARGAGKSSFMFRCCTDLNASLVSDDLLLCWKDMFDRVRLAGWPRRIGVSLSAFSDITADKLDNATLRRKQPTGDSWRAEVGKHYKQQDRKRILFDMDEFLNIYGVNYQYNYSPVRFIHLDFDNTLTESYLVKKLTQPCNKESYSNEKVHKHFIDYLNIGPSSIHGGSGLSFDSISAQSNRLLLTYGRNFFNDFEKNWLAIENAF